jgi:hypothetical protein
MADVSTQQGNDNISTDDLATLNGAAVPTAQKAQRMKPGFGVDGDFRDVSKLFPMPVDSDSKRTVTYYGRSSTFRMPGRAAVSHKLWGIFNAAGSAVLVDLEHLQVDVAATAVMAVTQLPPLMRMYRITAAPTSGTAGSKVARDTALTSSSSVSLFQDASADGTASATALAATIAASGLVSQAYAPRLITAAGYEIIDTFTFLQGSDQRLTLRAGEGVVLSLESTAVAGDPTTAHWTVDSKWTEYTVSP